MNLTKLSLVDNAIAVLPIELFRCVALQTLLLDNIKVTELPPELAELVHLSVLSYEHNPVVNPPAEIRNQGLQQMLAFYKRIIANAPACHIKGIECEEIGGNLNLDEFQLEELPFVVHRGLPRPGELWNDYSVRRDRWGLGMTHLTSLSLKSNFLVGLPELISRLQLLTALVASNNEIKSIPDSVGNLTDLVTLDLTDNNLVHIPPTTSNLSQLRLLLLNNNSLVELPVFLLPVCGGGMVDVRHLRVCTSTGLPQQNSRIHESLTVAGHTKLPTGRTGTSSGASRDPCQGQRPHLAAH